MDNDTRDILHGIAEVEGQSISPTAQSDGLGALPPQERAFVLYCEGWRVTQIAEKLGVGGPTVQRWIRLCEALDSQQTFLSRRERLLAAIEAQRQIASAAWEAYHHERAIEDAILRGDLDHLTRRKVRTQRKRRANTYTPAESEAGNYEEEYERPHHISQAARFLAIALEAQREVARLQGFGIARRAAPSEGEVRITVQRRPDTPDAGAYEPGE